MGRVCLKGNAISPGIAIGKVYLACDAQVQEQRYIQETDVENEIKALNAAALNACRTLETAARSVPPNLSEYREIMDAQVELARDPRILENAAARIRHKKICAAWALTDTISELCSLFHNLADPYLGARAQDIRAIGKCILDALTGVPGPMRKSDPKIMVANEFAPSDLMDIDPRAILGLLTVEGGTTSHIAILARGLKIPAVAGLVSLLQAARNDETAIVDGLRGQAIFDPDDADLAYYQALQTKYGKFEKEAQQATGEKVITRDGIKITIFANVDRPQEINDMLESGAEGIGLYRTEFSYMNSNLPSEEDLFEEYSNILKGAKGKSVIIRTLDIGADKLAACLNTPHEPNPALGMRGIRLCLDQPALFHSQLRALLRAGHKNELSIMLPMLTSLQELKKVKDILKTISQELSEQNIPHLKKPKLGVMIETPAAVMICEELAKECDFLSLGTNDLLHYMMAIDRNNHRVAYLHDPLHPGFIRAIKKVADAGKSNDKPVCVCGELAADPQGVALLLGLGVHAFSASPRFIPIIKHLLRKLDARHCALAAARALNGENQALIKRMLKNILDECMDSVLLFPTPPISTGQQS